jgi:ubiquinone/menaquinone biosynthesis C-methylase UbiE
VLALAVLLAASPRAIGQDDEARRDVWQQPDRVMDALGIGAGSRVADVGCGDGYFVLRLARRVGNEGRVFGVDVDEGELRKLRRRVREEGFTNVEIIESRDDDALLSPASVDVVLIVNAYHEMRKFDAMLHSVHRALSPGGLLAIIDAPGSGGRDRKAHQSAHTIAESMVRDDAARNGFHFLRREPGFERTESSRREWFFLVFQKPTD